MFCDRVWGRCFSCVDSSSCTGQWLGESTANITGLEKCFCSQAAWQKWWLVQAPAYLSQVINFSPIKTPTGMMEKVGSLTSLTQASCGMLQCVGGWSFQSPVAENVQERNTFLPRWLFCSGNKKGFAWRLSLKFLRHVDDTFTLAASSLAQDTSEDILEPSSQHPSLFSPRLILPVSPNSLPPVWLTATTLPSLPQELRVWTLSCLFHSLFQIDILWSLISRGEQWVHSITQSDMKSPRPCEWEVREGIK